MQTEASWSQCHEGKGRWLYISDAILLKWGLTWKLWGVSEKSTAGVADLTEHGLHLAFWFLHQRLV